MTTTTIETLTDDQITRYHAEAGEHGDLEACRTCDVALGRVPASPATVRRARTQIAGWIAYAQGEAGLS